LRLLICAILVIVALVVTPIEMPEGEDNMAWLAGYKCRKEFDAKGSIAGAQTDYQIKLHVFRNDDWRIFGAGWERINSLYKEAGYPTNDQHVIKIGSTYYMYYGREEIAGNNDWDIYLATSDNLEGGWTKYQPAPVLSKGAGGAWDGVWVNYPYVVKVGDTYYMFYEGSNPTKTQIGYATSPDGINWTKQTVLGPILPVGAGGSWDDEHCGTPSLIEKDGIWYLYYHGAGGAGDRIGYATAPSITGPYTKSGSNPVLLPGPGGWDSNWTGKRDIFKYGSEYVMFYEGNDAGGVAGTQIGLAKSTDLDSWTKYDNNPIIKLDSWATSHCGCVSVFVEEPYYYMFYTALPYNGIALCKTKIPDYLDRVTLGGKSLDWTDDIRFTNSDGESLGFFIKSPDAYEATFLIEFDSIPVSPGSNRFRIYYDKAMEDPASNASNAYVFYDDFSDGTLDKWTGNKTNWTVDTGRAKHTGVGASEWLIADMEDVADLILWGTIRFSADRDFGGGYCFRLSPWKPRVQLYPVANQFSLYITEGEKKTYPAVVGNKDYKLRIECYKESIKTFIDDVAQHDETTVDQAAGKIKIWGAMKIGGYYSYFDNISVRKYVIPEPTLGNWGDEVCDGFKGTGGSMAAKLVGAGLL